MRQSLKHASLSFLIAACGGLAAGLLLLLMAPVLREAHSWNEGPMMLMAIGFSMVLMTTMLPAMRRFDQRAPSTWTQVAAMLALFVHPLAMVPFCIMVS